MSIYDSLNKEQLEAVKHDKGPLLILAGAGSGKTRVLTHRIAYLIEERKVNPWNILAITFTNKAAKEMRERVDNIIGYGSENVWVSTFHSTCVRILRRYIDRLGFEKNFTIYDTDDQKSLMRDICKLLQIDTKNIKERTLLSAISSAKDAMLSPEDYEQQAAGDYLKTKYAAVYKEYQKRLKSNNALDFDDLIFKTVELLQSDAEVLTNYQRRFQYIMVDEYQDTNYAQFCLIKTLASVQNTDGEREHNLCVVGDDDQSIYKFRGADIYNILNFEQQFPNTKIIKLEQNYRSTQNILNAANEVIANNMGRKEKSLWTENEEGQPIRFTQYDTEYEEAEQVVKTIETKVQDDNAAYQQFAVLYRTNAQSRIFEEKLIYHNIPYKLIGGVNFYQRKEIKDLLSYLKTIDNGVDNLAVKRIINIPRRGIGLTSIDRIESYADTHGISFYDALKKAEYIPSLGRAMNKISPFVSLIEILKSHLESPDYTLEDLINEILEATGYLNELQAEGTEEAEGRIENINELINKAVAYEKSCQEPPTLSGFLEEVALVAEIDNLEDSTNVVVLMTLHSAKGLEFPYVFLCGMEDGLFPGYLSITSDDPTDIEEERRLCYVGITRAMKELYLSASRQRMIRGETQFNKPSRFVLEIPRYLLKQEAVSTSFKFLNRENKNNFTFASDISQKQSMRTVSGADGYQRRFRNSAADEMKYTDCFKVTPDKKPYSSAPAKQFAVKNQTPLSYGIGDKVKHMKFGTGTVTDITQGGKDYEVTVCFETAGTRKMLSTFANLKKIN